MTNTKETSLFSHDSMREVEESWSTFCTLSCVFVIRDGGLLVCFVNPYPANVEYRVSS